LTGYYYQGYLIDGSGNIDFTGLTEAFSRVDPNIDYWNGDRYFRWEPVTGWAENYSVKWEGYIYISQPGNYGLGTMSDDGSQVWIDGNLVVNNSEAQWYDWEDNISEGDSSGESFPSLYLSEGLHEIYVTFYELNFWDGIELWWLPPDRGVSDIPYYGTSFWDIPPTFNPNTNWEIVPQDVLFTSKI
jgi:PA14 domain